MVLYKVSVKSNTEPLISLISSSLAGQGSGNGEVYLVEGKIHLTFEDTKGTFCTAAGKGEKDGVHGWVLHLERGLSPQRWASVQQAGATSSPKIKAEWLCVGRRPKHSPLCLPYSLSCYLQHKDRVSTLLMTLRQWKCFLWAHRYEEYVGKVRPKSWTTG